MASTEWLGIRRQVDVEQARRQARESAKAASLNDEQAAEWALVASELATNLLRHTSLGGSMSFSRNDHPRDALVIHSEDMGPGIASVADAEREGFSTANGLGGGLPTVRRLSDELDISTSPAGTSITVRRWLA